MSSAVGPMRRLAAWGVHFFTALGLPLAFLAAAALYRGDAGLFFAALWCSTLVDSVDGFMARAVGVKQVLPTFDGRRLDDIIDFITFAFLPALAVPALGIVPDRMAMIAVLPLLASGYGFCQDNAKTEESFVGFPSYWNIVVLYLYVMKASPVTAFWVLAVLSILVFVPVHYLYPSRTRFMRPYTLMGGTVWAVAIALLCVAPDAPWAVRVASWSLLYPLYYGVASLAHHRRVRAGMA